MKKSLVLVILILFTPLFLGCNYQYDNPNPDLCIESENIEGLFICEKVTSSYFDTNISLKIYYQAKTSDNQDEYDDYLIDDVFNNFLSITEEYHQYLDKYNSYDGIYNLHDLNQSTGPVEIDSLLYDAIEKGIADSGLVTKENGDVVFNIALEPVLQIWHNARESDDCDGLMVSYCPVPNDEIDGVEFNTDLDDIYMDRNTLTFEFLKPNMGLDLGGFAKGYTASIVQNYLESENVTYLLNMGNSIIVTGNDNPIRDNGLYYIALETPDVENPLNKSYYQYIKIPKGMSVVTSGVNQRYFIETNTTNVYHHIIDPNTYYPGGEVMSVTIITPNTDIADTLSTGIFLLDLVEAINFVNSTNDLEAVWYLEDGTIEYSNGFYSLYNYDIN